MQKWERGKAYPTQLGDVVTVCPVCRKQVILEDMGSSIMQILFHNDRHNTPCNGTGKRCLATPILSN